MKPASTVGGVFAVSRGIFDDPDFADEPFTQREAFMWLVANAAWREHKTRGTKGTVTLQRGEFCFSIRFLAQRWKWSKSRVERMISALKNRDTIRDTSRDNETIYSVNKYNDFQLLNLPKRDTKRDSVRDTNGTAAGHERDKLEVIEVIEVIEVEKEKTNVFSKKGSLLSPDWKMETADLEFAKSAGFTEPEAQVIAQKFKAHFAALPDSKARRGDWSAAWESFVLNAPKRPIQTYAKQSSTGYVPFVPAKVTKPAEPIPAPVIHTEEEKARIRTLREMVRKGIPVQPTTATTEVLQ